MCDEMVFFLYKNVTGQVFNNFADSMFPLYFFFIKKVKLCCQYTQTDRMFCKYYGLHALRLITSKYLTVFISISF